MLIERRCFSLNDITLYDVDSLFGTDSESYLYDTEEQLDCIPVEPVGYYHLDIDGYCDLYILLVFSLLCRRWLSYTDFPFGHVIKHYTIYT